MQTDNCRLCRCPLKINFGDFQKTSYISTENLFKVSKREGCKTYFSLVELFSKVTLRVEKSAEVSERVNKACAWKENDRNTFELNSFIGSSLKREKEAIMFLVAHILR